jgi:hypothetical protein
MRPYRLVIGPFAAPVYKVSPADHFLAQYAMIPGDKPHRGFLRIASSE